MTDAFSGLNPFGIGTNRFDVTNAKDVVGLQTSAQLVVHALEAGANYIDVAHSYSRGMAQNILKLAFEQTDKKYCVTVKSKFGDDRTAEDAIRRVETSLANMGIEHAAFFVCWSIMSYSEFEKITQKGGIYEGALRLKELGIIDSICFSTHAPVQDIIKIIESGAFDGVTLSYNLTNATIMRPVLDAALEHNVSVVVMNPLGGGVIPQNRDYFSFACNKHETNTVQAALRFAMAHPAIKVVLNGLSSETELDENIEAFTALDTESATERYTRVTRSMAEAGNFCSGCRYCDGCPKDIPVYSYMQAYNALLLSPSRAYNRTDPELLKNIQLFRRLDMDFACLPDTSVNPCSRCGHCESRCTQNLNIINALDDIYVRAGKTSASMEARKARLDTLLNKPHYKKVAFYPAGGYTSKVINLYRSFFGEPPFEYLLFDSNEKMWGTISDGHIIHAPGEIEALKPDALLVSSYNYAEEIYNAVKHYENTGIHILRLHNNDDIPWSF